jgi:hypothetical protein
MDNSDYIPRRLRQINIEKSKVSLERYASHVKLMPLWLEGLKDV